MRIDEMQAGRKMDKAVSQYVFGNTEFVCRNCEDDYHVVDRQDLTAYIPVPNYSTDIAAAWGVVKKLQQHFFINIVVGREAGKANGKFGVDVEIGPYDAEGWVLVSMDAPEAPLAICRAALDLTSYLKGKFNNAGVEEI